MGMFDYVDYEWVCKDCGNTTRGFQSKDGECSLRIIKPQDIRYMYTFCESCYEWIELEVIKEFVVKDIVQVGSRL